MEERTKFYVGLDVHKDSISVAAAEPGRGAARLICKVTDDLNKLLKVLAKIGTAEQLHIVYEAGPTGFGLQRALKKRGYFCEIIAPSQIPRRPRAPLLTEAAWNYRVRARISREALARQEALSESIRTTAWKAQLRLTQRFAALRGRGCRSAIGLQAQREKAQAS